MVVESGLCSQKTDASLQVLEQWLTVRCFCVLSSYRVYDFTLSTVGSFALSAATLQEMKALSQAVAEAGFVQYASHASKMELQEFVHFAKVRFDCFFVQKLLLCICLAIVWFALTINSLTLYSYT